ncbi:MAG: hypothetical protein IJY38_03385, partial [Clostridia bacterium]|nr:hypothetical protein [Clostridia bacterium]
MKYAIDVDESGVYSIGATVSLESDATIKVTIDGKSIKKKITKAQESNGYEGTVKVSLGQIQAEKGVTSMKVEVLKGEADIVSYDVEKASDGTVAGAVALSEFVDVTGASVYSAENGLIVKENSNPTATLWGDKGETDFESTVSFMLGDDLATNFGIMLRAKHYSYHSAQAAQSWQGYYLNISPQTIALNRYDYGEQLLEIERVPDLTGSVHTLKIRMVGNVYT